MVKISRSELFKIARKYKLAHGRSMSDIRSMKHAELLALMRIMKKHPVHGKGVLKAIKDAGSRLINKVKSALFFPPNKLPGGSQKVYDEYADKLVNKIVVLRMPVNGIISKVANWITSGKYQDKLTELGYTDAFHLYSVFCFTDGSFLQVEKNQRISITKCKVFPANVEQVVCTINPAKSLGDIFGKTLKAIGDHEFFQYSADKNNCQKFLNDILQANGLATGESKKFIMQDAEAIFSTLSDTQKALAQAATDLGGKIEQVTTGQGKQKK